MSFFETAAGNPQCCWIVSTIKDESARQRLNGKALESRSFGIHKTIMAPKCLTYWRDCVCENWKPSTMPRLKFNWYTFSREAIARGNVGWQKIKCRPKRLQEELYRNVNKLTATRTKMKVGKSQTRVVQLWSRSHQTKWSRMYGRPIQILELVFEIWNI